jgi:hypothetical protein
MASFTRVNGAAASFEAVGRNLFFKTFTKSGMTQANLDDIVREVQQTATITAIGAFSAPQGAVNMMIEGADIGNQSSAAFGAVAGVAVSDMSF